MSEKADLEKKAVGTLQRYREAYARAEALEQEAAAARQDVFTRLNRLEIAKAKEVAVRVRPEIVAADQAAICRLTEIRIALSEATAELDSAFRTLAALDEQLGYIPGVSVAKPNGSYVGGSAEENGELP
ncbi:hypothetical protein IYY11_04860 [Methylocystis sp. H62]|uniref:Uncharacterized protein n=1 Tax=Methylocystis rosea TaxID=173366 RepID=A0A3G8MBV8_9HYPH|nr:MULTISPECIES: hypothetical protein [Methylocystis]AZG79044.1 hypothetical protein EHO51_19740 [Methylocystis rosea]MBG0792744.1 hypothetical protein [Methylocystis sp. H62]MBG0797291.1 hypothetical protein [Methylocystis sp. L43]MBG0804684.1 hypothetical protein [Methylocystis sp. H15]QGM95931.1 hypothetical protein F7D13_17775 [Methylocystis rosea]